MIGWLLHTDTIADWTPQRAQQAEREMLRREGIVVEPHYAWSKPAREREQQARINREQSWRKRLGSRVAANVTAWKRSAK